MILKRVLCNIFGLVSILLCLMANAEELTRGTLLGVLPEQPNGERSVVLQRVLDNSTASSLGLQAGDKILSINNQALSNFSELLSVVKLLKSQQSISVTFERDGETITRSGTMQPRPYEVSEHADVLYESVTYKDNQLRSITYRPAGEQGKAPAIFFIQGYTCGSIDMGMIPEATTKQLVEQFAAAGYVVFRVEKPGVGDSQSMQHCDDIDFSTETNAFTQALKALKQKPYVDSEQVYLWGHSLGVLHSAVVANREPVAGIVGYGGVLKPWYDYMLDIYELQSVKHFAASEVQAKRNKNLMEPVLNMWLNSDKDWLEITQHPATQKAIDAQLLNIDGERVIDRHYSFFRDLNRYNFSELWQSIEAPVFMMHGSLDIQAIEKNWAFDLANLSSNPKRKAMVIEGAEHAFMRYDTKSEYDTARANRTFNPAQPGERFDHRIAEQTLAWLEQVRSSQPQALQFSGINHIQYQDETKEKPFVGNGFLIEYRDKQYALTVKHALLEAKSASMNSVAIEGHISDWRIYPNHSPEQYVKLGGLLNESRKEALDMKVLSKDWLIFEVEENHSNLQILRLRETPIEEGESLSAYGCSYSTKNTCRQDAYPGKYIKSTDTNLRITMPDLDLASLRGLSGSPVLDQQHRLVGIVSNLLPAESGEGFDFAPANLSYLLTELNKLND